MADGLQILGKLVAAQPRAQLPALKDVRGHRERKELWLAPEFVPGRAVEQHRGVSGPIPARVDVTAADEHIPQAASAPQARLVSPDLEQLGREGQLGGQRELRAGRVESADDVMDARPRDGKVAGRDPVDGPGGGRALLEGHLGRIGDHRNAGDIDAVTQVTGAQAPRGTQQAQVDTPPRLGRDALDIGEQIALVGWRPRLASLGQTRDERAGCGAGVQAAGAEDPGFEIEQIRGRRSRTTQIAG